MRSHDAQLFRDHSSKYSPIDSDNVHRDTTASNRSNVTRDPLKDRSKEGSNNYSLSNFGMNTQLNFRFTFYLPVYFFSSIRNGGYVINVKTPDRKTPTSPPYPPNFAAMGPIYQVWAMPVTPPAR